MKKIAANILGSESCRWFLLLLLTCLPILATLSDYGITFDEPIYMEASWNIKKWLSLGPRKMFNRAEIDRYWKTDPSRNVHPSGVKWLYLVAQKIIFWEKDPYRQNGVLNVLLFSISINLFLSWWAESLFARKAVLLFILLLIPRFFAHVHFPATDIPMLSLLLVAIVCLDKTLFTKHYWLTGVILGFFVSIKFTSSLLSLPLLLFYIIHHRDRWKIVLGRVTLICLICLFVFYIFNPDWWFSPFFRSREFLTQTLTRRSWFPLTVYFGGHFYSHRGPFHYPFTIFFITMPLLHILMLLLGLKHFIFEKRLHEDPKWMITAIYFAFPFFIMALPLSPAHDGVRYLLPALPFAACFMTLGFEKLWKFVRDSSPQRPLKTASRWVTAAIALALFAGDLNNPARNPPFELSYYNNLVGGLSGAHRHGYETTYYLEILNNKTLQHVNEICAGESVYFPLPPTDLFFKHALNGEKIRFWPTRDPVHAKYMLIVGRPFVGFWEARTWPNFREQGKIPVPIWSIFLDSVPLCKLYIIRKN